MRCDLCGLPCVWLKGDKMWVHEPHLGAVGGPLDGDNHAPVVWVHLEGGTLDIVRFRLQTRREKWAGRLLPWVRRRRARDRRRDEAGLA